MLGSRALPQFGLFGVSFQIVHVRNHLAWECQRTAVAEAISFLIVAVGAVLASVSMTDIAPSETLGDSLIPVINKLQDIFSQVTIDFKLNLPQVAVVGSQSSGKSSVLEALVRRDFLPRGPDICTRRPLVLQLVKVPPSTSGKPSEWGEFLHAPGKLFYDFDKIRQEILNETERVTGANKNVSDKPIRLKICSPKVLTMTLVDLPGMTKVPVGDQPSNIEQRIRDMLLEYVRQPSTIILAVSPANVDLVNSDALQLAQLVDPEGARTIGVLTKLDIMDRGTNAVAVLKNAVVPLRLGYIGIVNRSQADINASRSMSDARSAEEAFFASHREYADVAGQCGTANLARRLNVILVEHIRLLLPNLRRKIADALDSRIAELKLYGEPPPLNSLAARGQLLLQLLCSYAERFSDMLAGKCLDMPVDELAGGARVRHIFQEVFGKGLRDVALQRELGDEDIRTAIKNSAGVAGTLLIPSEPFELLVQRAIKRLLAPALQCKELVYDELLRIAEQACPPELDKYPVLQRRLATSVLIWIQQGAEPAERMISDLVECEHDFINTDHPEFIGGTRAVRVVMEQREIRKQQQIKKEGVSEGIGKEALKSSRSSGSVSGEVRSTPAANTPSSSAVVAARGNVLPAGLKGLPDSSSSVVAGPLDEGVLRSRAAEALAAPEPSASWFSWLTKTDRTSDEQQHTHMQPVMRMQVQRPRSEHEEVQVEVIRLLVQNYFDIVRKNLTDAVPKAVMHFLVHHSQRGMQQHLIRSLYKEELFNELTEEREDLAAARRACRVAVEALQAAAAALDDVPAELGASLAASKGGDGDVYHPPLHAALSVRQHHTVHTLVALDRHPSMSMAARMAASAAAALVEKGSSVMEAVPNGAVRAIDALE